MSRNVKRLIFVDLFRADQDRVVSLSEYTETDKYTGIAFRSRIAVTSVPEDRFSLFFFLPQVEFSYAVCFLFL